MHGVTVLRSSDPPKAGGVTVLRSSVLGGEAAGKFVGFNVYRCQGNSTHLRGVTVLRSSPRG